MKNKIDISIIVPIYNSEKYLKKCLHSLINQTKSELEFILVNDGSFDNSEKIIKSYQDSRIKYYKNKNQGIGKTRNFGINKASGKYLMFIDSDDYIEKDTCEILYKKAQEDNLDLVVCDFYREYENGKLITEKLEDFTNTTLKQTPKLINIVNMSPWNKLYKTELIKKNNIKFNEKLKYEDTPFVFETLDKANKIGKINQSLNHYVIHNNSETTIRDKRIFDILQIIKIIREYSKEKKYLMEELNKWTVRNITNYTIQQRNQVDKKLGMKFIDEAFSYLQKEIPDYKDDKYYEQRGFFRKTIEKSKNLSKIYCYLYYNKTKN